MKVKKIKFLNSQFSTFNFKAGQSLVELLVVIGLSAIFLPALITGLVASREGKAQQKERVAAVNLMQETNEAVRNVREKGWSNISTNGTFYPQIAADNSWELSPGSQMVGNFTRQVVISDVYRDSNGTIVTIGGTLDPSTKKVETTVSWGLPFASSVTSTSYLTRYLENASYTETAQVQFDAGTKTGTAVTNVSGGEVVLSGGGSGDWCNPSAPSATLDLPKNGVAKTITAIEGEAFVGTGENSSGVSFADVTISNTNPPIPSLGGTFDGYKTNDIFGEANYAYIATDTNAKEIVILNISSSPFTEVGYFEAPGPTDADSVFVVGNTGYMTQGNVFRNFNLNASRSGAQTTIDPDGITLAGVGTSTYVVGTYAYISIAGSSTKMQIIDLSDSDELEIEGSINLSAQDAKDVFVNTTGTRAYLATAESASQSEFFIINTSNKSSPTLISSYEANGMSPKAVTVVTGNKAILVGSDGEEYQVIDITNENSPTRCAGLQIDTGLNGVAGVIEADGDVYAYIITDANPEFRIIEGGPGGGYSSDGTFESQTFNPGFPTAFNRLSFTVAEPAGTDIKLHVAVADTIAGSCSAVAFNFIGPDKTSGTFFDAAGAIPLDDDGAGYENPAQCFRYKAYLSTTDSAATPVLYDFTINYSP